MICFYLFSKLFKCPKNPRRINLKRIIKIIRIIRTRTTKIKTKSETVEKKKRGMSAIREAAKWVKNECLVP